MMNRTKFLISWKVQSIRGDRHKTSKQVNKPIMTECKECHKINIQKGRNRVNEVTPSLDRVVRVGSRLAFEPRDEEPALWKESRVCKGPGIFKARSGERSQKRSRGEGWSWAS